MTNNKDFLTWLREDFSPGLVAFQKAMLPSLVWLQEISTSVNNALTKFISEHHESIALWIKFSEMYPRLEPYITNIANGLNNPEFEAANDVIEMAHIFESIDLQKDPSTTSLLTVIEGQSFQNSLIALYESTTLNQGRLVLIKEALTLHNQKFYAGSICLLYGLIEGVLTESFEKANYILVNAKKIHPIMADGTVKRDNLTGLVPKLDHAITHNDQLKAYYSKIKTYELVCGDPEKTIPKTRNEILHGGSVIFQTEKLSAQLIIWLYSSILHIRVLGI